jgi:Fic family protein
MDLDLLKQSPIGQLIRITGTDARVGTYESFAFLPDPLPDNPEFATETWALVAEAMEALGSLSQACCQLRNPQLLIAPALASEALSTSALEGTYSTLREVLEARLPQSGPRTPEATETHAYEQIAKQAFDWVGEDRPITLGMLASLQGELARRSRVKTIDPGMIREHQVIIGPEDSSIYDARYVPPPPGDQLKGALEAWQAWISMDHNLPVAVKCALAHYQFEALHPFGDGNGRIGRLVLVLQLLRSGSLPGAALTISPWLLRRRKEYQDHLLHISQTGDWDPWVQFFCTALRDQSRAHVEVAQQLISWLEESRKELHQRRWGGAISQIVEDLLDWPIVNAPWVIQQYGVSGPTAHHAIERLVEVGILNPLTSRRYRRVYGAQQVMDLVERL